MSFPMSYFSNASFMEPREAIRLFSNYLRVTGVAHTDAERSGDPQLIGKRLGLLNGSSWITLWSNFFGRVYLPGVHLINAGNEAVQINFMQAHASGQAVPPRSNVDVFARYARELVELAQVDAVLITCSTMNRAYLEVRRALEPFEVPVFQIDRSMMERAIDHGGRVLVVATHGPTVESTHALLRETAGELGKPINYSGLNVEAAWQDLAEGDIEGHNQRLADAIHRRLESEPAGCVVLAQLSMTVLLLSYPNPVAEFGVPVFTSGQCGFEFIREFWTTMRS
jgi:aspartate/glutamate racemase